MKIRPTDKLDIINAYENNLEPMISIAKRYGVSRGRIYQILNECGVDTSKRRIPVSCTVCGTAVQRTKAHIRKTKNPYCSTDCYFAALENKDSQYWRHGQRIARQVVSKLFNLQPGNVVHHIDTNNYNNNPNNLVVFATQGDHIRHHRGFDTTPLWRGGQ